MSDQPSPAGLFPGTGTWRLVLALGIGVFVGGFDQTFVVPVLGSMLRDFDVPIDRFGQASWIVNGYLLGYTVAMPLMGRVADAYGRIRVFAAGLVIFMGGSFLVALAPNLTMLTVARALTALGGGALVPVALAITADALPGRRRAVGLATVSVLDDGSSLIGPAWGTLIGAWLGWRGLFWFNIVLAIPVLVAVIVLARGRRDVVSGTVDWVGGALLAAALGLTTFGLVEIGAETLPRAVPEALVAMGLLVGLGFERWERRVLNPLIDLRMFGGRLWLVFAVFALEGGALITALVNVPLIAEVLWERTGAGPGLVLMRMVLFMIIGGIAGGLLASRVRPSVMVALGCAAAAAGLAGMAAWPAVPAQTSVWLVLAVAGFGFTLGDAAVYLTVVDAVDASRRASVSALLQVCQTVGMIVGMALLASQGLGRFDERAADLFRDAPAEAQTEAYRKAIHTTFDETFVAAALVMVVAGGMAFAIPRPGAVSRKQ